MILNGIKIRCLLSLFEMEKRSVMLIITSKSLKFCYSFNIYKDIIQRKINRRFPLFSMFFVSLADCGLKCIHFSKILGSFKPMYAGNQFYEKIFFMHAIFTDSFNPAKLSWLFQILK